MKLASLKSDSRDGKLLVVNRALTQAAAVTEIPTMQYAIENWAKVEPQLQAVFEQLQADSHPNAFALRLEECAGVFPRCYQFLDGSVYLNHMKKARAARGAEMPPNYETEPLMYQGMSHEFCPPLGELRVPDDALNVDFEGEIVVITDDVRMGTKRDEADQHIKLFALLNDFTLRVKTKLELPKQFGFLQAKPINALSAIAVTPDELDGRWDGKMPDVNVTATINEQWFGSPNAATDYWFDYPALIEHAAGTRDLCAGTLIGAGTIANEAETSGYSSISEAVTDQKLKGLPVTPFLKFGDVVKIEVHDHDGVSIFGPIATEIVPNEVYT